MYIYMYIYIYIYTHILTLCKHRLNANYVLNPMVLAQRADEEIAAR